MYTSPRSLSVLLFLIVAVRAVLAQAGSADDLLPPPVRQAEKRTLGGNNESRYMAARFAFEMGSSGAIFSPDGKYLLTGGHRSGQMLWDVRAGREVGALADSGSDGGVAGAFTPDGKQLVLASSGRHNMEGSPVAVWSVASRQKVRSLDEDANDTPFTALAVSPEGTTVALAAAGAGRGAGPLAICF